MVENAARIGENVLGPGLRELVGKHPCLGEVRGLGVFWALELVKNKATREPIAPYGGTSPAMADLMRACKERGLLPFTQFNRLHAVPPCNVSESEAREGIAILDEALLAAERTHRLMGRLPRLATIAVVAVCVAACSKRTPSGRGGHVTITLYNGQHIQTTEAIVTAFEKATGIEVAVRNNDEDILDAEIVAEGSTSPADVIFTENSPALEYLQERGLLAKLDRATPSNARRHVRLAQRRLGRGLGTGERDHLQPGAYQKERSFRPASSSSPIRATRANSPSPRARPTSSPSSPRSCAPTGRPDSRWLEGIKANAGSHIYPDNETISTR